jgi:hypothetical protein
MSEQSWLGKLLDRHYRWMCRLGWHEWRWPAVKNPDGKYYISLNDHTVPANATCNSCNIGYTR